MKHLEFTVNKSELIKNDVAKVIETKVLELLPPMYCMTGNWRYSESSVTVGYNVYVEIKRLMENGGQYLLF